MQQLAGKSCSNSLTGQLCNRAALAGLTRSSSSKKWRSLPASKCALFRSPALDVSATRGCCSDCPGRGGMLPLRIGGKAVGGGTVGAGAWPAGRVGLPAGLVICPPVKDSAGVWLPPRAATAAAATSDEDLHAGRWTMAGHAVQFCCGSVHCKKHPALTPITLPLTSCKAPTGTGPTCKVSRPLRSYWAAQCRLHCLPGWASYCGRC